MVRFAWYFLAFAATIVGAVASLVQAQEQAGRIKTTLGVEGSRFTLNGQPVFLLGISYYGGLGAAEAAIRQDLDDLQGYGFNWLRVWATWGAFEHDVSAVDERGEARDAFLKKLQWLVDECEQRGMVVDVTLTRGKPSANYLGSGNLPDFEGHRRAVATIVKALRGHGNWYLDLANERDVRDARYVATRELLALRELARSLAPQLLVTASFGGHDLSSADVRDALLAAQLDFLSVHRPRHPKSPAETEIRTRQLLAVVERSGQLAPVHHQEPFRRGYGGWEPSADDFLTDLRGAVAGGAAGWCFHNGSQRGAPENRPRRSFDLRDQRLFEQLDAEELKVMAGARAASAG